MSESKLVQKFVQQVNELVTLQEEKNSLFDALRRYQTSSDVKRLVNELKRVLNEPTKLEIYDYVRPLIRPQHQQIYDKITPAAVGTKLRVIKLQKRGNESFGFAVRGGYEHNIGIFVSHVEKGSQAEQKGLRLGDEIVRVNGFTIAEAIHEEVLNLIKGRDEIELKVTYIGMVPIKQNTSDPVTWQYVDKLNTKKEVPDDDETKEQTKIFINLRGATSLGCSIISGPRHFPGIYIESVRAGSLAEDYGLEAGDQILEVNGRSFVDIQHKEAMVELKASKELNIVLGKGAGLPLLGMKLKNSPKSSRKSSPRQLDDDSGDAICEILENNVREQEDKMLWEEERAAQQRHQDAAMARQMDQEKELKAAKQKEEKIEKQRAEEKRKQQERLREQEEARQREEEARKREKQKVKEEEQRKKKQKEEEEKQKQEMLNQSAVLAGRAAPSSSMKPTLLGAAQPSSTQMSFGGSIAGGTTVEVAVRKEENIPLDMEIEGGLGSPLGGKIIVADVFPGGAVDKCGEIGKGDQLLSINGILVVDVTLSAAQELLWEVEQTCPVGDFIRMEVLKAGHIPDDETTYF